MLSFRSTGNVFVGNRTRYTFAEFLLFSVFFLVSRTKDLKFGTNRFIRSGAISDQTHKPAISTSYVRLFRRALAPKVLKG